MSDLKTPKFPLAAEFSDLKDCLKQMGERPLKLVAEKVQKRLKESPWNVPRWTFAQDDGIITDRKLLSNEEDSFQFSMANEESKQDFHVHDKTFELYVSDSRIEIAYLNGDREESMSVSNGVLIVPPVIEHKVKLYGISFVFQASTKGHKVHHDKKRVSS